jgi:hypothetical protein
MTDLKALIREAATQVTSAPVDDIAQRVIEITPQGEHLLLDLYREALCFAIPAVLAEDFNDIISKLNIAGTQRK